MFHFLTVATHSWISICRWWDPTNDPVIFSHLDHLAISPKVKHTCTRTPAISPRNLAETEEKCFNNNWKEALFNIAKTQKQPEGPLASGWIKKLWGSHPMGVLSDKKEQVLVHGTMWMTPKTISLSVKSQMPKAIICSMWFCFYDFLQKAKQKHKLDQWLLAGG